MENRLLQSGKRIGDSLNVDKIAWNLRNLLQWCKWTPGLCSQAH